MNLIYAISFASTLTLLFYLGKVLVKNQIQKNKDAVSITKLDKDLWKLVSLYVRKKDMDWKGFVNCFTCGKYENYKLVDAGHYIPKATSGSYLKFYEKNIHVQCQDCNRIKAGNYAVYKVKLIEKYGAGIIEHLNALRKSPPLTVTDYQNKISYYADQLKMLK